MAIGAKLNERSGGICELCSNFPATAEYTVTPKADDPENQVALCDTCLTALTQNEKSEHRRCLEGSIWNTEPAVQALSYRLLQLCKEEDWADSVISSIDLDDNIIQWAMSAYDVSEVHKDAFGNVLENGDTVILTQGLNVKGTSFTAAKGTTVKRIRLVSDNTEQIEGKINDQTIVILTKFVKKG